MRLYTFTNFYLSSIQQGIQSAHCLHELFLNYPAEPSTLASTKLFDWANNHKTMIVLNGGDSQSLSELYGELVPLARSGNFPLAKFSEDERSLNNALTCVGIVLPEAVYGIDLYDESSSQFNHASADIELKKIISRYRLAH